MASSTIVCEETAFYHRLAENFFSKDFTHYTVKGHDFRQIFLFSLHTYIAHYLINTYSLWKVVYHRNVKDFHSLKFDNSAT